MHDIFKRYDKHVKEDEIFSFSGAVSKELVQSTLDKLEAQLEEVEKNSKTKKKVFNVLVEILQNLNHHIETVKPGQKLIDEGKNAAFKIWADDNDYHISTGNFIRNQNVKSLESWLVYINSTTEEELRALYKEKLNDKFTPKGGGGLGFIDIARKSGQKLVYSFDEIDADYSFFSFQINIPKEN